MRGQVLSGRTVFFSYCRQEKLHRIGRRGVHIVRKTIEKSCVFRVAPHSFEVSWHALRCQGVVGDDIRISHPQRTKEDGGQNARAVLSRRAVEDERMIVRIGNDFERPDQSPCILLLLHGDQIGLAVVPEAPQGGEAEIF